MPKITRILDDLCGVQHPGKLGHGNHAEAGRCTIIIATGGVYDQPVELSLCAVGGPSAVAMSRVAMAYSATGAARCPASPLVPNWVPEYGNNFYAFNCTLLPGCQETTRPIPVGADTDGSTL